MTSDGIVAPEGGRLLKDAAQNGIHILPATTRDINSVLRLCQPLEIAGPLICINGARIHASPDGPLWVDLTFPRKVGLDIAGERSKMPPIQRQQLVEAA